MKMPFLFCIKPLCLAFAALFLGGCMAMQEQRAAIQEQKEDTLIVQDDLRRMRGRLEVLEQEVERLTRQVAEAGGEQSRAVQGQMQGVNSSLDDMQKRLRAMEATRETDRKEIIDTLSRKITEVMNKQGARSTSSNKPRKPISNEGYEHEVAPGETLSAIAKAYGANSADIMDANGLSSPDKLRVGQKLFIPAP